MQLKVRVLELILDSGLSNQEVADIAGCSVQWVYLFKGNRIRSPNVDTIEKLYNHFSPEPLLEKKSEA